MSTSLSHGKSDSSPLLALMLTAHGGLENWERVRSLRADIVLGRPFWSMVSCALNLWRERDVEVVHERRLAIAAERHVSLEVATGLSRDGWAGCWLLFDDYAGQACPSSRPRLYGPRTDCAWARSPNAPECPSRR